MKIIDTLWLHRIIRFGGGLGFMIMASRFEGGWPLFIFGGILLVTAFFRPKRCYGTCESDSPPTYADENKT